MFLQLENFSWSVFCSLILFSVCSSLVLKLSIEFFNSVIVFLSSKISGYLLCFISLCWTSYIFLYCLLDTGFFFLFLILLTSVFFCSSLSILKTIILNYFLVISLSPFIWIQLLEVYSIPLVWNHISLILPDSIRPV